MTPAQQAALDEYLAAVQGYSQYTPEQLKAAELGASSLQGVTYDPKMLEYEMSALKALEEQGREGLTAQDRAAMAQFERETGQAARGRRGAIEQSMRQRGISGSGLDLVSQLQSAESANELAAMKALEREGLSAQRRTQGQMAAGQMAGQLGSRQYQQAAEKAAAQDRIAQFNAANRMNAQQYNIGMGAQTAANRFQAQTGGAQMKYNAAAEAERARLMREEERRRRRAGAISGVLGAAGGVAGAYFGKSPEAAAAGYQIGSSLGQGFGYANGGVVPGTPIVDGDSPLNDTQIIAASPGEVVIPRSIANDPIASAAYVAGVNSVPSYLKKNYADGGPVGDLRLFDPEAMKKPMGPELPPNYAPPQKPGIDLNLIKNPAQRAVLENMLQKEAQAPQPSQPDMMERAKQTKGIFDFFKGTEEESSETPEEVDKFDVAEFLNKSKDEYKKAKERSDYLAYADLIGQGLANYANSQRKGMYLPGKFENIGEGPTYVAPEQIQYKSVAPYGEKQKEESRKALELALKYQEEQADRVLKAKQYEAQLANQELNKQIMLMGALGKEGYAQMLRGKSNLTDAEKEYLKILDQQAKTEGSLAELEVKGLSEIDKQKMLHQNDVELERLRQQGKMSEISAINAAKQKMLKETLAQQKERDKARAKAGERPRQPSEFMLKSGSFATRMKDANEAFKQLKKQYSDYDPTSVKAYKDYIAGNLGVLGAPVVSDYAKLANQYEKEFVSAVLRLESGADLPEKELEREAQKYFPRPGNSRAQLARKEKARQIAIDTMEKAASGNIPTFTKTPVADEVVVLWKGKNKVIKRDQLKKALELGAKEIK